MNRGKRSRMWRAFSFALSGMRKALASERHLRFHFFAFFFVLLLGYIFRITAVEWAILFLVCGSVIGFELMNTAIERAVDLAGKNPHPLAAQAKDIAASAVLFSSLIALIVGLIIFVPRIFSL